MTVSIKQITEVLVTNSLTLCMKFSSATQSMIHQSFKTLVSLLEFYSSCNKSHIIISWSYFFSNVLQETQEILYALTSKFYLSKHIFLFYLYYNLIKRYVLAVFILKGMLAIICSVRFFAVCITSVYKVFFFFPPLLLPLLLSIWFYTWKM